MIYAVQHPDTIKLKRSSYKDESLSSVLCNTENFHLKCGAFARRPSECMGVLYSDTFIFSDMPKKSAAG